jgi:hypothetical protein
VRNTAGPVTMVSASLIPISGHPAGRLIFVAIPVQRVPASPAAGGSRSPRRRPGRFAARDSAAGSTRSSSASLATASAVCIWSLACTSPTAITVSFTR